MKVGKPQIRQEEEHIVYRSEVQLSEQNKTLWYKVNKRYADFVSDRSDASLSALLIPAMAAGENIYVEGTVSEDLYYSLSRQYQVVLQEVIPSLQIIDIFADKIEKSTNKADGVATGFSGGIDSFFTLADHYYSDKVCSGFRLTHLLYQIRNTQEQLFQKRFEKLKPLADRLELPFISISSNIENFYSGWSFQQTHTPRRVSIAHLLQNGIGKFMYSSAVHYRNIFVGEKFGMQHTDPVALPLLSTGNLKIISVGSEFSRVEKTIQVAQIEDSREFLTVCVNDKHAPGSNCSTCWKCRRTLLTLEIAGFLNHFDKVFDLQAYKNGRERHIAHVLRSNDPLSREIVSFAKKNNFSLPLFSSLYAKTGLLDLVKNARRVTALLK